MACGLPGGRLRCARPAEIVRDGESGWLVPPDDEQALVAALSHAATDADERADAAASRDRRRERYGWQAIGRPDRRALRAGRRRAHRRARHGIAARGGSP